VSRESRFGPSEGEFSQGEQTLDDLRLQISVRLRLEEVVEQTAEILRDEVTARPTARELSQLACRIYDARRARDKVLDRKLFGEPAWDILLALYCLPARGEMLGISSLAHCADVPATTGLRWEKVLRDEGLIERGPHVSDKRRQLVRLTGKGRSLLESYLTRLYCSTTPVPKHPDRAGG
jgi:DNA-binding MarR family transcriptional regulator